MDLQRAGARSVGLADNVGIAHRIGHGDDFGPETAHSAQLDFSRDGRRHVDGRRDAQRGCGIGDPGAVVAARGGHNPGLAELTGQQIVEGTAELERARSLQVLHLEGYRIAQPQRVGVHIHHRGPADVGGDPFIGGFDVWATDHATRLSVHAR